MYILADDLGYAELGSYGQSLIETPNLDALAARGMRFTQHYSGAPVCAPARCVLLTGQHSGHAHIRGNDEWRERGEVWDYQAMFANPALEGQRPIPDSLLTIGEVLQQAAYKTAAIGKWGLGAPGTEGVPNRQGFDFFYGYNCQRQAHTYYPLHLWRNEERHLLNNKMVPPHANLAEDADPNDSTSYADFRLEDYAPDLMQKEALQFIRQSDEHPFFLYYASPIPHVPLQAPEKWIQYYRQKLGPEEPHTAKSYFPCQYPRATYAAMISYLDEQIGALINELKAQGKYDNTLIIFSSDNGPTYTGGADTPFFDSAAPFKSERGWAKGYVHEGGIRVPMIAAWPGQIAEGSTSDHISGFQDVMPTFCEIVGLPIPTQADGISFLPSLRQTGKQTQHDFLYWEFPAYGGQQAVRMGNWKGIRKDIKKGEMAIALYNLSTDPQELQDVASQNASIVSQMDSIMRIARQQPTIERFKMTALGD
ncbi:MAG: arylsulfatase [Bacteroidota bacterium]